VNCCCLPTRRSAGALAAMLAGLVVADRLCVWVADRIWWIGGTLTACMVLAIAASMALEARSARRGAAFAELHGIRSRADVVAGIAATRSAWAVQIAPGGAVLDHEPGQIADQPRPAIEPPPKSWLCEACYWVWPDSTPFCGVCGGSRASHGAAREVVVRQAIGKEV
jgi:hypothetical protein